MLGIKKSSLPLVPWEAKEDRLGGVWVDAADNKSILHSSRRTFEQRLNVAELTARVPEIIDLLVEISNDLPTEGRQPSSIVKLLYGNNLPDITKDLKRLDDHKTKINAMLAELRVDPKAWNS